jgi:hypothetical protein
MVISIVIDGDFAGDFNRGYIMVKSGFFCD